MNAKMSRLRPNISNEFMNDTFHFINGKVLEFICER